MRAYDEYLLRFLDGHDKQFTIPIYQRNYDWRKEHCEALLADILRVMNHNKDYFIGSLVVLYDDKGEHLIIDGQQRITTISLLLLAIANFIQNNPDIKQNLKLSSEQIIETYLLNKYADEKKRIRLKPINKDNDAFLKLFDNDEAYFIQSSNVTINYNYFYSTIKTRIATGLNLDELFTAMNLLKIVKVELNYREDNPQEIFESLNSTGKQLEDSDLVRNFILMRQSPREQERLYQVYWAKIEQNTNEQTSDFIRHYLTYKLGTVPNQNMVYKTFKEYVAGKFSDLNLLEELLLDLVLFSEFYSIIINCNSDDANINRTLKYINKLKITVSYPFLFDLFYCEKTKVISKAELVEALGIVETFSLRRAVCDIPTNALNKLYATLPKDIRKQGNFESNYLNIFKFILLAGKKVPYKRFPTNEEFVARFTEKEIYHNRQYISYILEKLENYNNSERVDVEKLLNNTLTIEHIMPQALTREWKEALGDGFDDIHQKYLHTIGNLTLSAYNSNYSNKLFIEKRDMENGFSSSRLLLNKFIASQDKWNKSEITARAQELSEKALNVWQLIETTYDTKVKTSEYIYLSDDYDFTGHKPEKFVFLTNEYTSQDWSSLYRMIIDILFERDPSILYNLSIDPITINISDVNANMRTPYAKEDTLYFEIHMSTKDIISMIKLLLERYNIDSNELGILLRT